MSKSSSFIAADIVLLLDRASEEKAIYQSEVAARASHLNELILSVSARPHISLLMGGLDDEGQKLVREKLDALAHNLRAFELTVLRVHRPGITCEWTVEITEELMDLHKVVIEECWNTMSYPVSENAFFHTLTNNKPVTWVNKFADRDRVQRFNPHITISLAELEPLEESFKIKAEALALFQLGDYCMCAKEIATFKLLNNC